MWQLCNGVAACDATLTLCSHYFLWTSGLLDDAADAMSQTHPQTKEDTLLSLMPNKQRLKNI